MLNTYNHKNRWWIDALLLAAFFVSFILDLTGVGLHQWLGIAVGSLAAYHLLTHWTWVKSVSQRLARTSWQAQAYYLVDASLLLGFTGILVSGLVISTWLDLALDNFSAWRALHVAVSVVTLGLVCLKIALHGRWITSIARRYVFQPAPGEASHDVSHGIPGGTARSARSGDKQCAQQPLASRAFTERRDFLKLAGVIGAAAFISLASALDLDGSQAAGISSQAAEAGAEAATDVDSAAADSGQSSWANRAASGGTSGGMSASCSVRCPRGCSYPGHCRRYTDSNGNNRCDLGECL
jgi:hypothetical protein